MAALQFDHSKISVTAKLVAYFRQFSDIPFAQEVAQSIGAEQAFQKLTHENGLTPDIEERVPHFEARYKSIVTLISKSGIQQVLELASGFSLRGLAMTGDPGITYIESDLPELTAEKSVLVKELRAKHAIPDHGNHKLVVANALNIDELRAATKALRRDRGLIVVNEGLLRYLTVDERNAIACNVHALLGEFKQGIWITPDFSLKADLEQDSVQRERFRKAVLGLTGRDHDGAMFESEKEMDAFFAEQGFSASRYYQFDESPHLHSVQTLKISPDRIEKMRKRYRVWVLRPVGKR